jgi:5-methylthioadenosine/S-adenosylhomocysteine deaminase
MKKTADMIVKGASIISMDAELQVYEEHNIAIQNGNILAIYPSQDDVYDAPTVLDATDCLVIPGLINAHTHMPMTYFRGLADDLPLDTWLNKYIWPLEAKLVKPQFVYDASLHAAAEMLLSGTVLANDMYFHIRETAKAVSKAGMRAMFGEAVIQVQLNESFGVAPICRAAVELNQEFAGNPLVSFVLTPHAIYTCDKKILSTCAEVAQKEDMLLHIHLSETKFEVDYSLSNYGKKPVMYLEELGLLDSNIVLAHGIWVDEDEMEVLAKHDVSVASCLESSLKLTAGILPIQQYKKHGVNICLGTDGVASNNNLDMFSEMDINAKLHKAIAGDPAFLPASEVLQMATIKAAKALGIGDKTGSIEEGKYADLAILSLDSLSSQPIYNPYSHIVYAMNSDSVRDVVVNGKIVVKNRKLVNIDEAELIDTAKKYKQEILNQL